MEHLTLTNDQERTLGDGRHGEELPRLAYSISEVADMLGVSQKTVRRLMDRELLKPMKAIRHIRISSQELKRFIRESQ